MKSLNHCDQKKLEIQLDYDPNVIKIDVTLLLVGLMSGLLFGFLFALMFGDYSRGPLAWFH
jgi:hypothetical protein